MSSRHDARLWAVQFLFQRDFNAGDLKAALRAFWEWRKADPRARTYAEELIQGVTEHRKDLDDRLQKYAENWDLNRMGAVDRNVMRVALYEMLHRLDVPPVVSINEAIDIAKAYSGMEPGRFGNGILDRACRELTRSPRVGVPANAKPQEE